MVLKLQPWKDLLDQYKMLMNQYPQIEEVQLVRTNEKLHTATATFQTPTKFSQPLQGAAKLLTSMESAQSRKISSNS